MIHSPKLFLAHGEILGKYLDEWTHVAAALFTSALYCEHNQSCSKMSRGREVRSRKHRNNGVTNKVVRNWLSLVVSG